MAKAKKRRSSSKRKTARRTARKVTRRITRKVTRKVSRRKPARKTSSRSKSTKADLEKKIADLEGRLKKLSSTAETAPPPPPKPAETAPPDAGVPLHERFRDIPTGNWNDQKPKIPGFTAPGNKYFATRQRLAYHPEPK